MGSIGAVNEARRLKVFNYTSQVECSRLYHAVVNLDYGRQSVKHTLEECMSCGFIPVKNDKVCNSIGDLTFKAIKEGVGVDCEHVNNTFHKSFANVKDLDPVSFYTDMLLYYLTTFGKHWFGYNGDPYVPAEEMKLPTGVIPQDKLVVVGIVSREKLVEAINASFEIIQAPSGVLLEQLKRVLPLCTLHGDSIASYELRAMKYKLDGTIPTEPKEVLRYAIYLATETTLVINNDDLIQRIKSEGPYRTNVKELIRLFTTASKPQLASIFLRYKDLFLAFKSYADLRSIINYISRIAPKYHKPLPEDRIQNITNLLKEGKVDIVKRVISKADTSELVKLINLFRVRLAISGNSAGVYAVRNNKTFVRENMNFSLSPQLCAVYREVERFTLQLLCNKLKSKLNGRIFLIPSYINYVMPTSEKQMIGNIPWGSSITPDYNGAFQVGISWFNADTKYDTGHPEYVGYGLSTGNVIVDIHLNSRYNHYGWNGSYSSDYSSYEKGKVYFTGDCVYAPPPKGGASAFYIDSLNEVYLITVNLWSGPDKHPFTFYMSTDDPRNVIGEGANLGSDDKITGYWFDPAKAMFPPIHLNFIGQRAMTLGIIVGKDFYFYGGSLTSGTVPRENNSRYESFFNGVIPQLKNRLTLKEVLLNCGAYIVNSMDCLGDEQKAKVVDLSPSALKPTTFISLLK